MNDCPDLQLQAAREEVNHHLRGSGINGPFNLVWV
jgi:hypothetical protein